MGRKTLLIFILFFFIKALWPLKANISNTSKSLELNYYENLQHPDSLVNKTYKELLSLMWRNDSIDSKTFKIYATTYYKKAKRDTSKKRMIRAYHNLSYLGLLEKTEQEIQYLDSIIIFSQNLKIKRYPEYAYLIKGHIFYSERNFKKSLDNYLMSYEYAKKKKDLDLMYNANYGIGVLKDRIGEYKEALKIFKVCKKYYDNKDIELIDNEYYLAILSGLTDLYRKNGKVDSSTVINKIGITKSIANNSNLYQGYFILSEGMNLYEKKLYSQSIDSLDKALEILKEVKDNPNIAFANFYLGKNYYATKSITKSIANFKKVDTIFQNINDLNPDLRETYEILIDYYKKNNDKNNELLYIKRLMKVDSILFNNYKYLNKNINKKYDTPELLRKKEILIVKTQKQKNLFKYVSLSLLFLCIVITTFLIFNYRRKKVYKSKFENLLYNESKTITIGNINNTKDIGVPQEIRDKILSNLKKFENEKGYLQKSITVTSLAKLLQTNTKYLSKIINFFYEKSFTIYINDLRVDFIVEELKINKQFRNYTIKAISEHAGFKNSQSFSQAFVKKTGIYPSYFIKNLEKIKDVNSWLQEG